MSGDTAMQQWMEIVQDVPVTDDTVWKPANTFLRTCGGCDALTMHYRREDHVECAECGRKTYRGEQGSILLEFLFWLGLILFVLIVVLKDVPW